jgi:hypothetical protein
VNVPEECERLAARFSDVRRLLVACLLAACGTPAPVLTTPNATVVATHDANIDAPLDASPDAAPDAAVELHVGAVPVPGEDVYVDKSRTIDAFDTTVDVKALPAPSAKWKTRKTLKYRGDVIVALHIWGPKSLALSVVDMVTENASGYPGTFETFQLGPIDGYGERPGENDAFPPRDVHPETFQYVGPVMFAIRVLPKAGAAESERRQYVVYTHQRSIFVAEKLVSETTWTPSLRLDAPRAKKLGAINPGWH